MRSRQVHDRATVSVEVTFAAFSGNERKKRGKGDKCVFSLFFFLFSPPLPFSSSKGTRFLKIKKNKIKTPWGASDGTGNSMLICRGRFLF